MRGDDRPDHVDVHLAAEFVGRELEHGPCDRDAGIVDEPGQGLAIQRGADLAGGREHRGLIGDVEQKRGEIGTEFCLQTVGVGPLAHAAEHPKPAISSSLAVAQPIPVDAPVITTDCMVPPPLDT